MLLRPRKLPAVALMTAAVIALGTASVWQTKLWASRAMPTEPKAASQALPPNNQEASEPANEVTFPLVGPQRRQRGVALGLFAEDISFSYEPLLKEIAALGASHVALIVPLYQEHGGSTSLYLHTRYSPTLEAVADAVRMARRENLEVTLFPIVRLLHPRTPTEWRGTLAPENEARWFASYEQHLGSLAALAGLTGATRLVVGSELSSLDNKLDLWRHALERVRAVFSGTTVYSANWDHYREATLFDLVDEAGVTGYFDLRRAGGPADVQILTRRWQGLRVELESWGKQRKQPWLFTELGYRSKAGSTATPWDETTGGVPDSQEQARAFEAFRQAWSTGSTLAGIYIWNWYGFGGPATIGYTPRGKPAEQVIKRLLDEL